jgi:DtxR family Mn-dependent transcriptional regulator
MMTSALSASLEDYLEVIFHVVEAKGAARPKDIVQELKIGASSVTAALKSLSDKDLVNYAPYDVITLTRSGEKIARDVVHRHETLREFFIRVLAADQELADSAACQMEHAVPKELVDRFVRFLEFVEMCPRGGPALLEGFRVHLTAGCRPDCFDRCPADLQVPEVHRDEESKS